MYCAVNEAFNCSPISKSLKNNNNTIDAFDNYSNVSINNNNNNNNHNNNHNSHNNPAFITAQGAYSNQGPYDKSYKGTTVGQLKNDNIMVDSDSFSLLDSDFSNDSLFDPSILKMKNQKKKKMSHEYYIEKMVKSLLDEDHSNQSIQSITSSENNRIYSHVKSCKICKGKVNKKMKEHFKPELIIHQDNEDTNKDTNKDTDIDKVQNKVQNKEYYDLGYDLKEILIIILAGIVLVFILDLLVKIGKRMK